MPFKWIRMITLIGLVALASVALLSVRAWKIGDHCLVERGQVVEGALLALCRELLIEGRVEGDLVALAWQVRIVGMVEGVSYLVAQDQQVRGQRLGWSLNGLALLLGLMAQVGIWWLGRRSAQQVLLPLEEPLPARAAPPSEPAPLVLPPATHEAARPALPRIESHALGMDNLPQGFDPRFFTED